ncbi:hypothetical protein ACHAXR_012956 [Thalassiosira sp. AJA248-18]
MVDVWCKTVGTLSKVAIKYPQSAYVGFTFCLQNEWQYVARVTPVIAPLTLKPLRGPFGTKSPHHSLVWVNVILTPNFERSRPWRSTLVASESERTQWTLLVQPYTKLPSTHVTTSPTP